ncbi:SDR family NAD(P)-dependent oxidoreductase [Erythrobacter sp. BLCC-B19]|uniref:SDR family NAD(P)-dependent oxidoreductase n=1 Tax=Erythrobacter sp. BLCC-B19 TaxID=3025315 RepID=UPI0023614895|nr:SDR family oxidoreductase [Erythrobacter sp. BLCC-B19]WDA39774.1 SDR family NAD(P)-dependent oxidoreductase [Erythrobacter sp. BLCC-B19]
MQPHALVTGGAQGIGRSVAERLAAQGWSVTAADRDEAALAAVEGQGIAPAVLDVSDSAAVAALVDRLPPLDVVVNCAGIAAELLPLKDIPREAFERMLRVNLGGTFILAREAARRMERGAIINIASRGYLGGAGAAHYVASKAAVVGLTRALAVELRWRGISVNAVAPGMVETRMIDDFTPEMRARLSRLEPAGGPMPPATIAEAVAYLASAAGRMVNGQVLLVDGGKSLGVAPC